MLFFRRILIFAAMTLIVSKAGAQDYGGAFNASVDAGTRWGFRIISPVTVTSSIVRLGDVVQPVDPNQAGWQRLRRAAIGLVPVSGEAMTIRRERLGKAILAAEATPRMIDWFGPNEVRVVYRQPTPDEVAARRAKSGVNDFHTITNDHSVNAVGYESSTDQRIPTQANAPALSHIDAKRVIHWIEIAMEQFYPDVDDAYAVEVPADQTELVALQSMSGVTHMEAVTPIDDGPCRFLVVARSINGPIESEVNVNLVSYPEVVVPTRSMGRGHRIQETDITLKRMAPENIDPNAVADMSVLIGQEVRANLRVGQAIRHDQFGFPILIHRGDLVEVRVIGGGVTVTTNGKSLGDGSESDLIEIETINPRKRLLARVAQHGVVEIVTRSPIVR
ncbi:flagellar basal body P-ring formation chaperone FlgA [Rubripirellula reticaptiva]|uniref:Flagellar basal body P-ring biosynthesis protein FlgA n=1 Tax=Rubripirellula reticaptiva TaxID=2528013 RepID=A0A5C6EGF6_9BACT|nr:flagellar basal body P-ring formation chaperone FlgA [Rubripirellula reticaptiva]TWU48072.1 flagellar basal body P-ring biosynthesis protein FlgA [Rubripirellula reticaptiva]